MAVVKNPKLTVLCGIFINTAFLLLKFVVFLYSHINLFFADTIDSFVDFFVIFLLVLFLRFNLNGRLTYLNMDIMFFTQWGVIIIFRIIIFLEQIADLIQPAPREEPLLVIIVSCVVIVGGIVLALLFVDEDDVIKFFVSDEEKEKKRLLKKKGKKEGSKEKRFKIHPIFAEALDNLATTLVALLLGLLLYFGAIVDYLYLIDDISNMVISAIMFTIACVRMWELAGRYQGKSLLVLAENAEERDLVLRDEGVESGTISSDSTSAKE